MVAQSFQGWVRLDFIENFHHPRLKFRVIPDLLEPWHEPEEAFDRIDSDRFEPCLSYFSFKLIRMMKECGCKISGITRRVPVLTVSQILFDHLSKSGILYESSKCAVEDRRVPRDTSRKHQSSRFQYTRGFRQRLQTFPFSNQMIHRTEQQNDVSDLVLEIQTSCVSLTDTSYRTLGRFVSLTSLSHM